MQRIGIIGPESTGKSTLCRRLSEQYGYLWIPEYARTYVGNLSRAYTYDDVLLIARRQIDELRTPQKYGEGNKQADMVLYDTELIITKVWMQHLYGKVAPEIEQAMTDYPMDGYLLLAADLPAEDDPLRENLDRRDYFFAWYEREIQATGIPYTIVRGTGETRTKQAVESIQKIQCAHR